MRATQPIAAASATRIIHAALAIGLVLVGATFVVLLRVLGRSFRFGPSIGYVTAGLAVVNTTVAVAFLRPRIPQRRADQALDDYWLMNEVRGASIIVWALIEGAGLLSWVGYLLTGRLVSAATAVLAIWGLIMVRPSRLEC